MLILFTKLGLGVFKFIFILENVILKCNIMCSFNLSIYVDQLIVQ